jgi:hypothetical protein
MANFIKGDKVIITGNDSLEHYFEIGQECTYIQDYGHGVHELQGEYGYSLSRDFRYNTVTNQSVSATCFKEK